MTLEADVQEVVAAVQAADLTRGDGQPLVVTDFDPLPGELDLPGQIAVTFGSMGATEWTILVRLYVSAQADVAAAERYVRATVPALDAALNTTGIPRSNFDKTWSPEFLAYIVESKLDVPREDF